MERGLRRKRSLKKMTLIYRGQKYVQNKNIAKEFTQRVKEKSIGKNVLTDLRPGQLMVKIVKDELTELMVFLEMLM